MAGAATIHPNWEQHIPTRITDGYSLEMTAKDCDALRAAASLLAPATPIAITFLPGETIDARIGAAKLVRDLGFEPMSHLSARRIASYEELEQTVRRTAEEAGVQRMFLVAGDPPVPAGPFEDALSMLRTGLFESYGVKAIGIAGHPEGHPVMDEEGRWSALAAKCADVADRGMAPLIVTQFGFDAAPLLDWLVALRRRGIDAPVRVGVPGPTGIKTLLRFAAHCGVGASAAVLSKYGISLSRLLGAAGPDRLVSEIAAGLRSEHGPVRLHFYPFGGLTKTAEWIDQHRANQN